MRIAMIAPLIESVPPLGYGGTERVVSVLTEELVRRGHDVTLFASGDSNTRARLVNCASRGLRLDSTFHDCVAYTIVELDRAFSHARDFDIIHSHVDYLAFPLIRFVATPTVSTTHGRLDLPETRRVFEHFSDVPLVAISDDQRATLPHANWMATIYNGIDLTTFHFQPNPGDYLVFLGRISPEKRVDRAIEIARDVGMRLLIAAKIDPAERNFYEHAVEPLIASSPLVEYVGEVDEREKDQLLGGAYANLFPIDWPEPFGLTMVESMATGTPVIAYRVGSVPEVVVDGVTGFACSSIHDMVEAVERVKDLDRRACRAHVEQHFSSAAMADSYERVYRSLQTSGDPTERRADLFHALIDNEIAIYQEGQ